MLVVYKLVIVRLGEHPRDDLPIAGALGSLGSGCSAGFLLFSRSSALPRAFGVYRIVGPGDTRGLLRR